MTDPKAGHVIVISGGISRSVDSSHSMNAKMARQPWGCPWDGMGTKLTPYDPL
jgi:hypothetical protein